VSRPRFITVGGAPQPTLFATHEDRRPPSERKAAGRYREPGLFAGLERDG
jgi:hypothetical protein